MLIAMGMACLICRFVHISFCQWSAGQIPDQHRCAVALCAIEAQSVPCQALACRRCARFAHQTQESGDYVPMVCIVATVNVPTMQTIDARLGIQTRRTTSTISYHTLYSKMGQCSLQLFTATWTSTTTHYLTVHYLRSVLFALGLSSDQSKLDWIIMRSMGQGARDGCEAWGLADFALADKTRLTISRHLRDKYTFEDLACFICMAKP